VEKRRKICKRAEESCVTINNEDEILMKANIVDT